MRQSFDVIVLGVGSMGAAACYQLASRGHRVLGLEQFDIPHDQGSHAGQTRIIRKAYFEHPDYVPLLERAYQNWSALEEVSGSQVYFRTGLYYAGLPDGVLIQGVNKSVHEYAIPVERLSQTEANKRFPQFSLPSNYEVIFEPDAGFLTPERSILLYVQQAIEKGAVIRGKEKVSSWNKVGGEINVRSDKGSYTCKKLVICAGPWAGQLIPGFASKLSVSRQLIAWVNPKEKSSFALGNFPCWLMDDHTVKGMYYGFPVLPVGKFGGPIGLKVALHYPGKTSQPDAIDRSINEDETEELIQAIRRILPNGYQSTFTLKTCLYTNTPDENFVLDHLPGYDQDVVIAAGFSGHGFKFASVVGEIMADLAMKGSTSLPIGFLNAARLLN